MFSVFVVILLGLIHLGSLAGVRNEADAKLLSEKQRQIADLQNQLKTLVSERCTLLTYLILGTSCCPYKSKKKRK